MDSPSDDIQSLPEGLEALRALVLTTIAERDAAVTERDILLAQNDRLRHLLRQLQRMQFGPRSERLPGFRQNSRRLKASFLSLRWS
jgi:transposase